MALEGTLRDFSFADILQLISLQRKTGVLTLKSEEAVTTVSFIDGSIVGAPFRTALIRYAEGPGFRRRKKLNQMRSIIDRYTVQRVE